MKEEKTLKIYDYEKENDKIDSDELLKQMTQYVNEEKEKLKEGDNK